MSRIHRNSEGDDLLSPLPDDILIRILCLMKSYKHAVKFSVLSRRWKDLYKKLPCLYFYEDDFCIHQGNEEETCDSEVLEKSRAAIHRHEVRVHTFHLQTSRDMSYWDWCVEHFTQRNVEHLALVSNRVFEWPQPIHPSILTCTSLETLTLCSSEFHIPSPQPCPGYPNLRECTLTINAASNELQWLSQILSHSPLLQQLYLILEFPTRWSTEVYKEPLTFSSCSLVDLYVDLVYLEESLQIRVVTPELLKMTVTELRDLEEDNNLKVVIVEAPKLLEISVPEDIVKVEFQQSGFPKLFESIRYAEFQGFPSLYKCEIKLSGLTLCANLANWLNDLFFKNPNLCYLTLFLCFEDDGSEKENYDVPLTFLSQSLLDLHITVKGANRKLQIKVVAPLLQKLILDCNDSELSQKIELQVEAPKMLEISMPQNTCDMLNLRRSGSFETLEGIVHVKSVSNGHHHIICLNFNNISKRRLNNKCIFFDTITQMDFVTFLELSHVYAYPVDIWNGLLIRLSALEALMFTNCIFQTEDRPKCFPVQECKLWKLKEIKFTDEAYYCNDGEKEMLSILLQNTPDLQILCFSLQKKKRDYKEDYFALLGKVMVSGDMVALNESSEEVELKILKGSALAL